MTQTSTWIVWNGSLGVLAEAAIGRVETIGAGRRAFLAEPYDVVGPFSLDELESRGRVAFGACLVMSRERWRLDQVELRLEGMRARRAFSVKVEFNDESRGHRAALGLPSTGALKPSEITTAFRRLAKTAHPDAGGSNERYRRIAEARDALLARAQSAA
ncbi:J domain-containing protein [Methylocella sp.]|uniref:J domain-containing protein n=1 Tax=Methylocella sp. TaxID=1978226 RepID=UPI003783020C